MTKLAIDGGPPVRTEPFPPWPRLTPEQVEAATRVLRSGRINYWTGEEGRAFEAEFARYCGCEHGVALANGTVALELALVVLGVGRGDEVIVPSRAFVATASCVVMRGARPVFVDVDRESGNLTAATIEPALTPRTRAIIVVHLAGWPCDMNPILELAARHDLHVIEDCAQGHGARYRGKSVGSLGTVGAWSFCQDKIMTTAGEGGMITTSDRELCERAWAYKDHGKSYDAVFRREHPPGFRWLHESFGTNFRMTEVQAAVGRAALRRLDEAVARRRQNAGILDGRFAALEGLRTATVDAEVDHAYYKYYAFVRPERLRRGWSRDRIMSAIVAEGIPCFSGSCSEVYLEKAFTDEMRPAARLPVARELGETSLMFLVHPTLSAQDLEQTCTAVEKVMEAATR